MNAPVRHQPLDGITALAAGLFWPSDAKVLMIWGYYDESGEYDASGTLLNMTIGGCMASADEWQAFDLAWAKILRSEGIATFHMKEFEAWRDEYNFLLADGSRDNEKHKRLLTRLMNAMLDHIDGFYAFGATLMFDRDATPPTKDKAHAAQMEDCISGAIKHAVLEASDFYQEPINLVFGKQKHFGGGSIAKYVSFYDYGAASGRIRSLTMADARDIRPLQAADLFAYEAARAQRPDQPERHPWRYLSQEAKKRGRRHTINWGPMRSYKIDLTKLPIWTSPGFSRK